MAEGPHGAAPGVLGWDVGGAHVKAAWWRDGALVDAAQWPCPLWQGLDHLMQVLALARLRWPQMQAAQHAVTMSGEMVDLFPHREDGVARIAAALAAALPAPRFYTAAAGLVGAAETGWCSATQARDRWAQVASANWLATARHTARACSGQEGLLVDIGSTTTDLIAFRQGRVLSTSRSDAQRLARSELVYQGVVRTPLCAVAQRIGWRGERLNVMNEFFATTADVYRLTGELDARHDQHPSADHGAKDSAATQSRLARMIGLDGRDGDTTEWRAFAQAWRAAQCEELRAQVARVVALHGLGRADTQPVLVSAGCGAFLVPELTPAGWARRSYHADVARVDRAAPAGLADWADVAAPAVAVAALYAADHAEPVREAA